MTAKVFCLASAKGGSGKTSLCATFATFLAQIGRKVLMIDSDFATQGLTLLYLKEVGVNSELIRSKSRTPIGLANSLRDKLSPSLIHLGNQLDFLPAAFDLQDGISAPNDSTTTRFHELLAPLRQKYDFIFIDAQAGADEMGQIAMSRKVSDEVVIVSEYDPMSAAGVERLKAILRNDLTYERTWVLLNKILPEFAESFSDFMEIARYLNPIPWDAAVVRAYARRRLAIDTETGNEHTIAVLLTLKGLCGESIQKDLEGWAESRAAIIRQPLEDQYADAEKEMAFLLSGYAKLQRAVFSRRNWFVLSVIAPISLVAISVFFSERVRQLINNLSLFESITYGVTLAGFMGVLYYSMSHLWLGDIEHKVLESRYDRQLTLVKDRLKRLEMLRTLDPEELLSKSKIFREASYSKFRRENTQPKGRDTS